MPLTSPAVLVPLRDLLRSCYSPDVSDLRHFLSGLPSGMAIVESLTSPGSFTQNVHEAAVELMARGQVNDALFDAILQSRPQREGEIEAVRALVHADLADPPLPASTEPAPHELADLVASLDEISQSLFEFVRRIQADGVSLELFAARAKIEVVRHRIQDTDLGLIGGARLAGLLEQLDQASQSRMVILAGTDDDQAFANLGTVLMAAAYARELAADLRKSAGMTPPADIERSDSVDLSNLELPELTEEELHEESLFAWQQNAEVDHLEELPIFPEGVGGPNAKWPDDADSIDYSLLIGTKAGTDFNLSGAVLERLVAANHFTFSQDELILFGLRGCLLAGDADHHLFSDQIACIEARPDHVHTKCVIGIYKRSAGQVAAFTGSTVPNANWLSAYINGGVNTNMLPTGVYRYVTGQHKAVPGALRMNEPRFYVARPVVGKPQVIITNQDRFTGPRLIMDNIHPAYNPSAGVEFNSAGCQTIQGTYWKKKDRHYGAWSVFRQLAGIAEHGQPFRYLLLTGKEARLADTLPSADQSLWRLRFGSQGEGVRELQRALGIGVDGDFGPGTMGALVKHQQATDDGRADGQMTRARLGAMLVG